MPRGQNWYFRVYTQVRRVTKGKVATYGQIAALLNSPRAARQVGWALNCLKPGTMVPWQRVINREGRITIQNARADARLQATLLRSEGVEVEEREGSYFVNLEKFGWRWASSKSGRFLVGTSTSRPAPRKTGRSPSPAGR